jgi:hypothetical protein
MYGGDGGLSVCHENETLPVTWLWVIVVLLFVLAVINMKIQSLSLDILCALLMLGTVTLVSVILARL